MRGNRAIWKDSWKAVTYHAPGTPFDEDQWELYHLEADFSECHDLASVHPERMKELVDHWWAEAGRYHVLPLDDRILERFLVPKPRPITQRSTFTYYPGIRVPGEGAPGIIDVSYTIDAHVEEIGDGVLICHGDRFSGYSLFIKNGYLVHDYNCAGIHYVARSEVPVPPGRHVLRYRFSRTGPLRGIGTLEIDGASVGTEEQPQTLGVHINAVGVSVGHNPLSSVSPEYAPPFRYGGRLEKVVIQLGNDRGVAAPEDLLD